MKAWLRIASRVFLIGSFLVSGCAGGLSREARRQVSYTGPFSQIQGDPGRYEKAIVLVGGKIIESRVLEGLSEVIVLHLPLDWQGRPRDGDQSEGRYVLRTKQFLDPAIYKPDVLISQVGRIAGFETLAVGGFEYVHPVIEPIEVKVWPRQEEAASPRFQFGIGVGISR